MTFHILKLRLVCCKSVLDQIQSERNLDTSMHIFHISTKKERYCCALKLLIAVKIRFKTEQINVVSIMVQTYLNTQVFGGVKVLIKTVQ